MTNYHKRKALVKLWKQSQTGNSHPNLKKSTFHLKHDIEQEIFRRRLNVYLKTGLAKRLPPINLPVIPTKQCNMCWCFCIAIGILYSCIATVYILGVSLLLNIFKYKSCSISLYSFAKLGSFQLLRILQQIQLFMVLPVSQFLVLIKCSSAAATLGPYQISQILGTCLFSMQQRAQVERHSWLNSPRQGSVAPLH